MSLKDIFGDYGFVAKVDVSDLDTSAGWYESKLGLIPDSGYDTPTWRQFNLPGIPLTAIGLNLNPVGVGSGGAVSTFVVDDIAAARDGLIAQGVEVGPIIDVGHGVLLCFFKDPDGNALGLRQNSSGQPKAAQMGG
jgi:glyoxylase I family protein